MNPNQLKSYIYDLAEILTSEDYMTAKIAEVTDNQKIAEIAVNLMHDLTAIHREAQEIASLMYESPTSWTECEIAMEEVKKAGQKAKRNAYKAITEALEG